MYRPSHLSMALIRRPIRITRRRRDEDDFSDDTPTTRNPGRSQRQLLQPQLPLDLRQPRATTTAPSAHTQDSSISQDTAEAGTINRLLGVEEEIRDIMSNIVMLRQSPYHHQTEN